MPCRDFKEAAEHVRMSLREVMRTMGDRAALFPPLALNSQRTLMNNSGNRDTHSHTHTHAHADTDRHTDRFLSFHWNKRM